jgi:FtsP/CotA-like multicopper oxidase with cupredoxin domain
MTDLTKNSEAHATEVSNDAAVPDKSRRNLFKLAVGAGAGAVALATSGESLAAVAVPVPVLDNKASPAIPPALWWKEPIPAYTYRPLAPVASLDPPVQKAANIAAGEVGRLDIQKYDLLFNDPALYELHVKEAPHSFTPAYPEQTIWGYDGKYPGPTLHGFYSVPMVTRIYNELPQDHVGYGSPEISMHVHNSHTPTESDGFPGDYWGPEICGPTLTSPGIYKDQCYPNVYAGFENSRNPAHPDFIALDAIGDPREALGTLWYHDHSLDATGANVVKGLCGFIIIYDDIDSGNENDTNPQALRLPSGDCDVPLMFGDMRFDSKGNQFYDQMSPEGVVGDMVVVNGKIKPFLNVQPRRYRLRLLNGGPTKYAQYSLVVDGKAMPFTYIANDGNLLEFPLMNQTKVDLAMAERADIIVDFSAFMGKDVYLVDRVFQKDTRKIDKILPIREGNQVLKFIVGKDVVADPSRVLTATTPLRKLPPIDLTRVVKKRTFEFARKGGVWTVNDKIFNVNEISATIKKGTAEIWTLVNGGGGWAHPVHIHFEEGRILKRNGRPPPAHERGRKDVYNLGPGESVEIYIQFRDFTGKHVMHCHNLAHEDHAMMVRWDIVD